MDVERVVHRVIRLHLVDESDLHAIAHGERPPDGAVLGAVVPVDEHPSHVAGLGCTIDLGHQVFPLESVALFFVLLMVLVTGRFTRPRLGRG